MGVLSKTHVESGDKSGKLDLRGDVCAGGNMFGDVSMKVEFKAMGLEKVTQKDGPA